MLCDMLLNIALVARFRRILDIERKCIEPEGQPLWKCDTGVTDAVIWWTILPNHLVTPLFCLSAFLEILTDSAFSFRSGIVCNPDFRTERQILTRMFWLVDCSWTICCFTHCLHLRLYCSESFRVMLRRTGRFFCIPEVWLPELYLNESACTWLSVRCLTADMLLLA